MWQLGKAKDDFFFLLFGFTFSLPASPDLVQIEVKWTVLIYFLLVLRRLLNTLKPQGQETDSVETKGQKRLIRHMLGCKAEKIASIGGSGKRQESRKLQIFQTTISAFHSILR